MADFTPTSGVGFMPGGGCRIGVEVFFVTPHGSPNTARREFPIPVGLSKLSIIAGSVALRPPLPRKNFFGATTVFPTDALIRVSLLAENGNQFPLISLILKTNEHPVQLPVTEITSPLRQDWKTLLVTLEQAGAAVPANCELQAVGMWS